MQGRPIRRPVVELHGPGQPRADVATVPRPEGMGLHAAADVASGEAIRRPHALPASRVRTAQFALGLGENY